MKKVVLTSIFILAMAVFAFLFLFRQKEQKIINPLSKITEKPLDKYAFEALRKKEFKGSRITIGKVSKEGDGFKSYIFYFTVEGEKGPSDEKEVSGLLHLPNKEGVYPVIVMFRGYIDREKYVTGEGTRHAGEVFANPSGGGFITLAPDFLGYGESASPSPNSLEERFQTYTTALSLLASIKNLGSALETVNPLIKADTEKIGIWGHSNGGHIALATLELTGKSYPTVLWAPVSKPFPYSILYYTDDFDDHGKALRKAIADFEKDYDVEKYSPTNFLSWINAPIELHQGEKDEAVPQKWSDELFEKLKELKKDVAYYTYPLDDHNFSKGSWTKVVLRNLLFFKENLTY